MSKIIKVLDSLVDYYDRFFRILYDMWTDLCRTQETTVITFLEYGVLILIYYILVDKKTTDANKKWIYRVLIGMFVLYGVCRKAM